MDWRLRAPALPLPFTDDDRGPAAVVKWRENELVPCDPGGDEPDWQNDPRLDTLPGNNRLVIYELPTRWSRIETEGTVSIAGGTFRDVLALVERTAAPTNFAGVAALAPGEAHLEDLGVTLSSCCLRPTASSTASGATRRATISPPILIWDFREAIPRRRRPPILRRL